MKSESIFQIDPTNVYSFLQVKVSFRAAKVFPQLSNFWESLFLPSPVFSRSLFFGFARLVMGLHSLRGLIIQRENERCRSK